MFHRKKSYKISWDLVLDLLNIFWITVIEGAWKRRRRSSWLSVAAFRLSALGSDFLSSRTKPSILWWIGDLVSGLAVEGNPWLVQKKRNNAASRYPVEVECGTHITKGLPNADLCPVPQVVHHLPLAMKHILDFYTDSCKTGLLKGRRKKLITTRT